MPDSTPGRPDRVRPGRPTDHTLKGEDAQRDIAGVREQRHAQQRVEQVHIRPQWSNGIGEIIEAGLEQRRDHDGQIRDRVGLWNAQTVVEVLHLVRA